MEAATKRKVSELEGAELDYWVARALGHQYAGRWDGQAVAVRGVSGPFHASSRWDHGGPVIERERIAMEYDSLEEPPCWWAVKGVLSDTDGYHDYRPESGKSGPTPLIAAMRCYVASKFGDEVGG